MAAKIALTSQGPYVGVSTLMAWLEKHKGFIRAEMSDTLIRAYIEARGYSNETMETVKGNKAAFRPDLQRFGVESGFDTQPRWIKKCLAEWLMYKPERDVVIGKVRTNEQAKTLKDMGFIIVELAVREATQLERAAKFGVSREEFARVVSHEIEHGIDESFIDSIIIAEGSVEIYGSWLANEELRNGINRR